MRVLVAMSGGVDSSVAAALEIEAGHEVVGATMKLWGGPIDSGCCSLADVTDARRVCDHLGIDHHVFNFTEAVPTPCRRALRAEHALGRTPNPCVECNRHLKFDVLTARAKRLGFDAVSTGHHARVLRSDDGVRVARGRDRAKDQSYVLGVLGEAARGFLRLPVGEFTKTEVRERAESLGLRIWAKPDSQDVCFIASRSSSSARAEFLAERIELHEADIVDDASGEVIGRAPAVELVTVGQRRGTVASGPVRRYAVAVDVARRQVRVGDVAALEASFVALDPTSIEATPLPVGTEVSIQLSAPGLPSGEPLQDGGIAFERSERRVAPGQLVVWYPR